MSKLEEEMLDAYTLVEICGLFYNISGIFVSARDETRDKQYHMWIIWLVDSSYYWSFVFQGKTTNLLNNSTDNGEELINKDCGPIKRKSRGVIK